MYKKSFKVKIGMLVLASTLALTACGKEEINKEDSNIQTEQKEQSLVHENTLNLDYAKHFKVDYYKDGYKIITDASDRKILLVPEGKEIPEQIDEKTLILNMPIKDIGIYSTIDAAWFRALGLEDKISTVTFDKDKWKMEEIFKNIEEGKTTFIGKTSSLDYELLQAINPTINLMSKSYEEKLFPKFDELGLNYISMGAYLEEDPRGRLEWVKFAGALFDKDKEAEDFYNKEIEKINKVVKEVEESEIEKPNVAIIYFSPSKEVFNVTKPIGHQAVTTELAGGIAYPTKEMRDDLEGRSNSMTNEEFYKQMQDADIIIYDNITGHGIQSISDMIEKAEFTKDLKAVKEKRVYGLQKSYWQSADRVSEIIEDLREVIVKDKDEFKENRHYFLMD